MVNRIRPDQITQVRGFADQRLRKAAAPQDPLNRRIPLIVEYQSKAPDQDRVPTESGEAAKEGV